MSTWRRWVSPDPNRLAHPLATTGSHEVGGGSGSDERCTGLTGAGSSAHPTSSGTSSAGTSTGSRWRTRSGDLDRPSTASSCHASDEEDALDVVRRRGYEHEQHYLDSLRARRSMDRRDPRDPHGRRAAARRRADPPGHRRRCRRHLPGDVLRRVRTAVVARARRLLGACARRQERQRVVRLRAGRHQARPQGEDRAPSSSSASTRRSSPRSSSTSLSCCTSSTATASGRRSATRRSRRTSATPAGGSSRRSRIGHRAAIYPEPVTHCSVCVWAARCDGRRRADDHLSFVPNLGRDHVRKFVAAGIPTVAELARTTITSVPHIGDQVVDRFHRQARLQVVAREAPAGAAPPVELIEPSGPGRGLEGLPIPSAGDLYLDLEGDPYVGTDGLEYLFGIGWLDASGELPVQGVLGPRRRRRTSGVRGRRRPHRRAPSSRPRPARLPLRRLRAHRVRAADGEVRHARGRGRRPAARPGARRPLQGRAAGRAGRCRVVLDQEARTAVHGAPATRPSPTPGRASSSTNDGSRRTTRRSSSTSRSTTATTASRHGGSTTGSRRAARRPSGSSIARSNGRRRRPSRPAPTRRSRSTPRSTRCATPCSGRSKRRRRATMPTRTRDGCSPICSSSTAARTSPTGGTTSTSITDYVPGDLFDDTAAIDCLTYVGATGTEKQSILHRYRFDPDQEHKLGRGARWSIRPRVARSCHHGVDAVVARNDRRDRQPSWRARAEAGQEQPRAAPDRRCSSTTSSYTQVMREAIADVAATMPRQRCRERRAVAGGPRPAARRRRRGSSDTIVTRRCESPARTPSPPPPGSCSGSTAATSRSRARPAPARRSPRPT